MLLITKLNILFIFVWKKHFFYAYAPLLNEQKGIKLERIHFSLQIGAFYKTLPVLRNFYLNIFFAIGIDETNVDI